MWALPVSGCLFRQCHGLCISEGNEKVKLNSQHTCGQLLTGMHCFLRHSVFPFTQAQMLQLTEDHISPSCRTQHRILLSGGRRDWASGLWFPDWEEQAYPAWATQLSPRDSGAPICNQLNIVVREDFKHYVFGGWEDLKRTAIIQTILNSQSGTWSVAIWTHRAQTDQP